MVTINISGPDGNAFSLIGAAARYGRQLGFDAGKISDIRSDMMSGDYDHLLEVFEKHFGQYVKLVRDVGDDYDYEDEE